MESKTSLQKDKASRTRNESFLPVQKRKDIGRGSRNCIEDCSRDVHRGVMGVELNVCRLTIGKVRGIQSLGGSTQKKALLRASLWHCGMYGGGRFQSSGLERANG